MREVDKYEFERHTRLLQVSSTESFNNGDRTDHYGYGSGVLVGWIRNTKCECCKQNKKTYFLIG